jgi:hypothetical protein
MMKKRGEKIRDQKNPVRPSRKAGWRTLWMRNLRFVR